MTLLDAAETATSDPWSAVVGQPQAVAALTAAVSSPVHAYLLVGPRGSGKRAAAGAFAGELMAAADRRTGSDPARSARHRRLAARQEHPDVFVLSPAGPSLRREEEVSQLIVEASRTPVEGSRKVLVVDRFHTATPAAAAALLKPVEEPAGSVVWVLLAEQVLPEHITIASRCTRVDFGPVPDTEIARVLVSEGLVAADRAPLVAAAAAGNLHRARVLATDERVAARREAWWKVPDRLDGSGAAVALLVAELRAMIDDAGGALTERHRSDIVALDQREEHFGVRGSGRSVIEAQHKREHRQFRTDEIRFGLATLGARYRDEITSMPGEGAAANRRAAAAMRAVDRLRATAESLIRSPNEALALQALLLDLPPLGDSLSGR
ncbi:MAG: hypothetical protein F4110_13900 [Acidimicrobiaceae bacterium]|nr:hypothetical protein [Acidimicrobiaceae bacterium]MYE98328.1 hypothetical protein [Acidimicrobiaceae bacterium]MYI55052.1 hypothetical protein [Acidimicrobiaceae bacterium]